MQIFAFVQDKVPSAFNDLFMDDQTTKASEQDLTALKAHFQKLITKIRSAEALGMIVLKDKFREFPKLNGKIYEPEGNA